MVIFFTGSRFFSDGFIPFFAQNEPVELTFPYSDTNLCNELLKKRKLIKISNHTEASTKIKIFEDEVEKRQIECD